MSSTTPTACENAHGDDRWMSLHKRYVREATEKEPEIVFIGDSLVQNLTINPLWHKIFTPMHAVGFGIAHDQTQNVLWRIENGELDNMNPKVILIHVGTHNYEHSPEQIADGLYAILQVVSKKHSSAKIILLGLLPRGHLPNSLREKNSTVNQMILSQMQDIPNTIFIDADDIDVVQPDGTIDSTDMYDYLHLTTVGYEKLCLRLVEELHRILGETQLLIPYSEFLEAVRLKLVSSDEER